MTGTVRSGTSSFAVLSEFARAAADDQRRGKLVENPAATVEGFDQLPADVQAVLRDMTADQLRAVARVNQSLIDNGFSVEHDGLRLSMF